MSSKEIQPLTDKEKEQLKTAYINRIGEFNRYLPESNKLVFNAEEFNAKLNDPSEVEQYRKGIERLERLNKQSKIYSELSQRYGTPPAGRHYFNRNFHYSFKTEDTSEAKEYNARIYREYCQNPEKVLYERTKRLLNFNMKPFIDKLDDEKALIDFYDNNQEMCEDAFVFSAFMNHDAKQWITPQLNNAINCIKKPLESLNECQKLAFAAAGKDEYLTLPKLTPEQASLILAGNPSYLSDEGNRALKNHIMNAIGKGEGVEQASDYYDKFRQAGWRLDKDFFVTHVAEEINPETGEVTEVSFDQAFENRPNVVLRERTADEIWHIKNISKEYEREYLGIWQNRFAQRTGKPFDLNAIEKGCAGGRLERLFNRTSKQYKEFIKTFKDYNDPESKDYLNKGKLREKAQAYKDYKLVNGKTIDDLSGTSSARTQFADDVLETLDDMEHNEAAIRSDIEANVYEIEPTSVGVPFLNRSDVEPEANNEINNAIENGAPSLDASVEEEPLNNSMDA